MLRNYILKLCAGIGLVIMMMATLVACSDNSANEEDIYYQFVDDLGTEIVLEKQPETVAVLFSSYADVWVTAGGKVDITVGESIERGYADETAILVDEGAGKTINTESLVAAKPDLVICSGDIEAQVEAAKLLNDSGIPAACFQVESFQDYLEMLEICTDITGDKEAYEKYGLEVAEEIEDILQQAKSENEGKRILFIRAGSSSSATKAKTAKQHFVCGMLEELGTYNIAENAAVLLDGLSIEEILREDPDYIFISIMGKEAEVTAYMDMVLAEPEWQALTAIKEGNYTYLPKDLFQFKPNARWAESYEYLMDLLYGQEE